MNQRTYKIRSFSNGKNRRGQPFVNYSLTIPSHIAEKLPSEMQFYCELTDEGLLFRPVPPGEEQVELPPWATNGEAEKTAEKPKRSTRKRPTSKAAASKSKPRSKPRSKPKTEPKPAEAETPAEEPQEPVAGEEQEATV